MKKIFYVGVWQWMKHGCTTIHLKQKDCQLSGQQLVKDVQSDQKLNSGLARLWHPYFGTRMVFCSSTIFRKVNPLTATIIWHCWVDWTQKSRKIVELNELSFELLLYPPYSPDLSPSDYWLFADLKKMLQGKRFGFNKKVIAETEAYFESKDESFYNYAWRKLCWWTKSNFSKKLCLVRL